MATGVSLQPGAWQGSRGDSDKWVCLFEGTPRNSGNPQEILNYSKPLSGVSILPVFGSFKHHLFGPWKVSVPWWGCCFKGKYREPCFFYARGVVFVVVFFCGSPLEDDRTQGQNKCKGLHLCAFVVWVGTIFSRRGLTKSNRPDLRIRKLCRVSPFLGRNPMVVFLLVICFKPTPRKTQSKKDGAC